MPFRPEEVLFSPTTECNLTCSHCSVPRSKTRLPEKEARRFLKECATLGIKRVGFTGGEPFLAIGFLCELARSAVKEGLLFDRIMTNGVWWPGERILKGFLSGLRDSGYDGSLCVSVDAFHSQDLKKVVRFIKTAVAMWRRPDVVSLACVSGARDRETAAILKALSRLLKAKIMKSPAGRLYLKSSSMFIKVYGIDLAPTGKASILRKPWDGRWFKEDYCKGPGNVFLVMPDGDVKPCCGYASDDKALTVGNIRRDSARDILKSFRRNRFASTVFDSGLRKIRKRLEGSGVRFPGKTSSHCFFCEYVLTNVPKGALDRCLDR